MADPPSYEESASEYGHEIDSKSDSKVPQRISIREEVGVSRSQHVAALVSKLLPQVRDRAKQGLSKSTLLLLPSNQECCRRGQLVGFPEDELPILIQLEGRQDTLEFWTQQEALDQLQNQMLAAISDAVPNQPGEQASLKKMLLQSPSKSSFWGRKQIKTVEMKPAANPAKPPVTVEVQLDEVHFRSENEYGLYETLRGRCVLLKLDVR